MIMDESRCEIYIKFRNVVPTVMPRYVGVDAPIGVVDMIAAMPHRLAPFLALVIVCS